MNLMHRLLLAIVFLFSEMIILPAQSDSVVYMGMGSKYVFFSDSTFKLICIPCDICPNYADNNNLISFGRYVCYGDTALILTSDPILKTNHMSMQVEEYKTTGEALVEVQDSIDNADSGYLCPMCGTSLAVGAKTCPSCKTRLPEFLAEKSPATDASVQVELPPYVQKLFDASEQLCEDPNKFPAFKKAVDEMRRRAASSQKKLDKINVQALGENMTQDEREALEGSYDVVRSGLDKFLRAIDAFDSLELPVDEFHLQCALEVVVSAVEDMRRAGSIVQGYMV